MTSVLINQIWDSGGDFTLHYKKNDSMNAVISRLRSKASSNVGRLLVSQSDRQQRAEHDE